MNQEVSNCVEMPGEGFYIENSGAVLFAVFLPTLFKNLGCLEGENISDPLSAVMAIHYAVTGNSKIEKNDLLLPKILCGLEDEFVVDAQMERMKEREDDVNEMLTSLIQYWKELKNTSIPGLQESFLKRRGLLTPQTDGWLLQVEKRGIDILLGHLPWNIAIIKLPWMKGILKTQWF